jgi:hypothetical protein
LGSWQRATAIHPHPQAGAVGNSVWMGYVNHDGL